MTIHGFDLCALPSRHGGFILQSLAESDSPEENEFINHIVNVRLKALEFPTEPIGGEEEDPQAKFRKWIGGVRNDFAECISHQTGQEHIPFLSAQAVAEMILHYEATMQ